MAYLFLMLGVSLLLPLLRLAFRLRLGLPLLFALGMLTVCHGWYQAHAALADGIFFAMVGIAALSWVVTLLRRLWSLLDGWREERTGLHENEFIETRRHWFTDIVPHNTNGGVQVLNVIKGDELIVESPTNAFEPFIVHYAETFIIPACVGEYTIRPYGSSVGKYCGTIKAYVRFRQ